MVKSYRKKPVVIQAVEFRIGNEMAIAQFCPELKVEWHGTYIKTLEGDMRVSEGDYIIKGVDGEFYPIKVDIFQKTYEEVEK